MTSKTSSKSEESPKSGESGESGESSEKKENVKSDPNKKLTKDQFFDTIKRFVDTRDYDWLINFEKTSLYPVACAIANHYGYYFLFDVYEYAERDEECFKLIFHARTSRFKRLPVSAFYTFSPSEDIKTKLDYLFQAISVLYNNNFNLLWDMFADIDRNAWLKVITHECANAEEKMDVLQHVLNLLYEYDVNQYNFSFFKMMPCLREVISTHPMIKNWKPLINSDFMNLFEKSFMYETALNSLNPSSIISPDKDMIWYAKQTLQLSKMGDIDGERVWTVL
ncbi:MAG: hypothetical protein ACRC1D_02680, partial [Culicoidibacterales bacterium]